MSNLTRGTNLSSLTFDLIQQQMDSVFVGLKFSIWEARRQTRPEDLGVDPSVEKALGLGVQKLASPEALAPMESIKHEARKLLNQSGLEFAQLEGSRVVPRAKLKDLEAAFADLKTTFDEEVVKFLNSYEEVKTASLLQLAEAFQETAKTEAVGHAAYRRAAEAYPSRETVAQKFNMKWWAFNIKGAHLSDQDMSAETANARELLKGLVGDLRGQAQEELSHLLGFVAKTGKVRKPTIEKALATLERLDALNTLGDAGLTQQIAAARTLILKLNDERTSPSKTITEELADIRQNIIDDEDAALKTIEDELTGVGRRRIG